MSTSDFDPEARFRRRKSGPDRGHRKHERDMEWVGDSTFGYDSVKKAEGTYCDGTLERLYARRRNERDKWQFYPIGDRCTKCGEIILDEDSED